MSSRDRINKQEDDREKKQIHKTNLTEKQLNKKMIFSPDLSQKSFRLISFSTYFILQYE